jgi:hypothetical protein
LGAPESDEGADSSLLRRRLPQAGHEGAFSLPFTNISVALPQSRHTKSYNGIRLTPQFDRPAFTPTIRNRRRFNWVYAHKFLHTYFPVVKPAVHRR